jgi:hypothetical protein
MDVYHCELPICAINNLLKDMKLGLITVCFGSTLWWILPDSPHTAKFLTERERVIAVERLKSNKTGVKNTHHKQYQVFEALKDLKVWMLVAAIFFHNMTNSLQTNVSSVLFSHWSALLVHNNGSR